MKEKYSRIGIVGAGVSNIGAIRYLRSVGDFHLTLRSDKRTDNILSADRALFGDEALSDIDEELLLLSPTVRRERAELRAAKKRGTKISSDTELFFENNTAPVFGVTGSSGKSTTSFLISDILGREHHASPPLGNYGESLCENLGKYELYVAELSSFQLNYFAPRCKRAVLTNATPNHLDWHTDLSEYLLAKMNLLKNSEDIIYDYDAPLPFEKLPRAAFAAVSSKKSYSELSHSARAENYITVSDETVFLNGKKYIDLGKARRKEEYNIKNYALAIGATLGYAAPESAEAALNSFSGLRHRAETVASMGGIKFVNSSIDTSPERTLETLRAFRGRVAVIISGKSKGLSNEMLARELPRLTSGAVLMGEVGERVGAYLCSSDYPYIYADNMDDAVLYARSLLGGDGTVILSPAGTSFDLFKDYKERGEAFINAVNRFICK